MELWSQNSSVLFYIFFTDRTFFHTVFYPINFEKYVLTKNPLNYYLLKVTKFHGDSFENESARSKKNYSGSAKHHR